MTALSLMLVTPAMGQVQAAESAGEGASAYALLVHGSGRNAPAHNEDEINLDLQWTPKSVDLRGLSFRMRCAVVMQRGGSDADPHDFRFIVNHDFPRS